MHSKAWVVAGLLAAGTAWAGEPLLGPGVGNPDVLLSEGSKLYNRKQYAKAAENFLRATRANPAAVATYLQLARAWMQGKQLRNACYAYRVFLKASPETADRKKAEAESDTCERQLKVAKKEPADMTQKYVETRAAFYEALDKGVILGAGGAAEHLRTLVQDGFMGPELGELGTKLGNQAVLQADEIHRRALAAEKVSLEKLRMARPLYHVAAEVGASPADASSSFLDGLSYLQEREYKKAEALFTEAARGDKLNNEYVFYRALSIFQGGDRERALKVLEERLKDDPRTAVLRVAQAMASSPEGGAQEFEKLMFLRRNPADK